MAKILVVLSAGLIVGVSSAAMAQQVSTPSAPSGASPATTISPLTPTPNTSPLTVAPANGVLTNQSSSEVPAIVNPSPTETIRLDSAAASAQALQIDPRGTLDAEGTGDVAFRGLGRVVGDPLQDLLAGGQSVHAQQVARAWGVVTQSRMTA